MISSPKPDLSHIATGFVRIHGPDGVPCGAGVLLTPYTVCTLSSVLEAASGQEAGRADYQRMTVSLDVPALPDSYRSAFVEVVVPSGPASSADSSGLMFALLRLDQQPMLGAQPATLVRSGVSLSGGCLSFAFSPRGFDPILLMGSLLGEAESGLVWVEGQFDTTGAGAPIWLADGAAVAGLLTSRDVRSGKQFMVPLASEVIERYVASVGTSSEPRPPEESEAQTESSVTEDQRLSEESFTWYPPGGKQGREQSPIPDSSMHAVPLDISPASPAPGPSVASVSSMSRPPSTSLPLGPSVPPSSPANPESASDTSVTAPPTSPSSSASKPPSVPQQLFVADRQTVVNPIMLSDSAVGSGNDLLGYVDYARALADFIKDPKTLKPLTIGIDAPWGSGKTSLMTMVREQLETATGRSDTDGVFPTVWFDAWKYDAEESLWAALTLRILKEAPSRLTPWSRAQVRTKLLWRRLDGGRLMRVLGKALLYALIVLLLGVLALLGAALQPVTALQLGVQQYIHSGTPLVGALALLMSVAAVWAAGSELSKHILQPLDLRVSNFVHEPDYRARIGFLSEFQEDFKSVVESITDQSGKRPLVIFVDDLDRCTASKTAQVIEAINLLLPADRCVFLLAMDSQAVARSIEAKYKWMTGSATAAINSNQPSLGHYFLEKIVQINFRIPPIDTNEITHLIEASLRTLGRASPQVPRTQVEEAKQAIESKTSQGKTIEEATPEVLAEQPTLPPTAIEQASQELIAQALEESPEFDAALRRVVPYVGPNPRKIKRFINLFRLQAMIANRRRLLRRGMIELEPLALFTVLSMRWPEVINAAIAAPNLFEDLRDAYLLQEELRRAGWVASATTPGLWEEPRGISADADAQSQQEQTALRDHLNRLRALQARPEITRLLEAVTLMPLVREIAQMRLADLTTYIFMARAVTIGSIAALPTPTQ